MGLSHASHPTVLLSVDLASEDSAEWEQHLKKKNGLELSGIAQPRRPGGWEMQSSCAAGGRIKLVG